MPIYVEEWGAGYGSPYKINEDEDTEGADGELVEDGKDFVLHDCHQVELSPLRLAFVDGVRRVDVSLYQRDEETGHLVRGVAGTYACGAVVKEPDAILQFGEVRIRRLVVWGSGWTGELPSVTGGFDWQAYSIDAEEPDAPLLELQKRMRAEEATLAASLAGEGYRVICDGPLDSRGRQNIAMTGMVKTHNRGKLEPKFHRLIPTLGPGQRCSLFALGSDRYSCYMRLADTPRYAGPWYGIIRLEIPQAAGLQAAIGEANLMAAILPQYAGVAHKDPRAPQNLRPIGALEKQLRHRMGDTHLSIRAVRQAVALLREGE